jgi:non-specific serine/threonine protein kinase
MLLVIDTCEHLLDECAALAAAVLRSSATVHVLATSRESIGIDGERTWAVPGLALAPSGAAPDQMRAADAVRLYLSRADAVQPALVITDDRARVLHHVCARLDGIPLAIELAAARGRILTIEQIAARLDDRFRLLLGGDRRLPRQKTLQATVDWSYEQLSELERRLFRRLAVFPSTWSLDAATNVCSDTRDEFDTIDLLARLVEKSLVLIGEDAVEGRRYRMLETIRQYGDGRMRESGERDDIRARHAEYYRQLARSARAALLGHEQPAWLGLTT